MHGAKQMMTSSFNTFDNNAMFWEDDRRELRAGGYSKFFWWDVQYEVWNPIHVSKDFFAPQNDWLYSFLVK